MSEGSQIVYGGYGGSVLKSIFGCLPDGTEIHLFTLTHANGLSCKIITYGGIITELQVPDREGNFANIVLGYHCLENYLEGKDYRGAIIGRMANRIANASFTLNQKTYELAANDGLNHMHGRIRGFDKRVWRAWPRTGAKNAVGLLLLYGSPNDEEGYPGRLGVCVEYTLTAANELCIEYSAKADKATPINLTNHSYWNLAGRGDVLSHELTVAADHYTPMNGEHIPTGKIEPVVGTPFDFRTPTPIGGRLSSGYDTNYALFLKGRGRRKPAFAARAHDPESGRTMELRTNQPGLQFYSGAFLPEPFTGFCLETQNYPDAVHHANFPSPIFAPGRGYNHRSVFHFSTD